MAIRMAFMLFALSLHSCAIDSCEGLAFFEREIRIIFLDDNEDVRISDPIRILINGNFVNIVDDGIVDLKEWQENGTNDPATIDLNAIHFLEYQLDFLEINEIDTIVTQTDIVNLAYTLNNNCQYLEIETMIVRHNDEIIFEGNEFGAYNHQIRK